MSKPIPAQTSHPKTASLPFWRQLRWILILYFVLLAILPVISVTYVILVQTSMQATNQVYNQLDSVVELKHDQVSRWLEQGAFAIDAFLAGANQNRLALFAAAESPDEEERANLHNALVELANSRFFKKLFIYNAQGRVILSSTPSDVGKMVNDQPYFDVSLYANYLQPPLTDSQTGEMMMYILRPLRIDKGAATGVLAGQFDIHALAEIMTKRTGLGESGETYLVSLENNQLWTPSRFAGYEMTRAYHSQGIDRALNGESGHAAYDNYRTPAVPVFGSYRFIPELRAALLAEIEQSQAMSAYWQAQSFGIGAALAAMLAAVVIGLLVTQQISHPITALTETASRIAAGDLGLRSTVKKQNEVGVLAVAFNTMADQLQEMIGGLERRVAERTAEAERRANQIATGAEISRAASQILDPDEMLARAVELIRERFDLYYVGAFLVDSEGKKAVLRAGTGEAGQMMVSMGHQLAIGGDSMVGWACANKQARMALDTDQEVTRFANPLLPNTRSEMALPLQVGDRVLGALSVQSSRVGAFDQSDLMALQGMADQLAVALTNAQLFEQIQLRAVELTRAKEAAEVAQREAEQARQAIEVEKEKAEAAKEEADKARQEAEAANRVLAAQMWQTAGQALLNEKMRGEQNIPTLARNVIQQLCAYLDAPVGTIYVRDGERFKLAGSFAYTGEEAPPPQFQLGEGLIGQAALEKRPLVIANLPEHYLSIRSSLGSTLPRNLLVAPFIYEGQVVGVVELGTLLEFTPVQMEFLQKALENVAVAFITAQAREHINELLIKTQQQAEELQAQGEELQATNEELEIQTESLRASEAKLKANQSDLEAANAELEEKALTLQEQRMALDRQNQELRAVQQELERKAAELALASRYKSEFLANMSHELRTPLNSLLILAGLLAENPEGNLTPDQVESAQIIYNGGKDLLNLINDILDLSKVEAGRLEFHLAPMSLEMLAADMHTQFMPVAKSQGLDFQITLAEDLPATIDTDRQRVEQIVKNLLANAFKFTEQGGVRLTISRPPADVDLSQSGLHPSQAVAISVTDTGIGIAPEHQQIIFEAFQQADGSTSRQYGGTGLGLTISRELAKRLGGQIGLVSERGKGSTFTLYLPVERRETPATESQAAMTSTRPVTPVGDAPAVASPQVPSPESPLSAPADDREQVQAGQGLLLIIEDDPVFAKVVCDYAHRKNFKCLIAGDGETGLKLVRAYAVDAIILDLKLPGMSGWEVLETLKQNPDTRHIPVHIMSASDEDLTAYKLGAIGFLTKPISQEDLERAFLKIEQLITRKVRNLLLVEDDANLRKSVKKLLEGSDVAISETNQGATALAMLAAQPFDCIILDLNLPDMSGFEVLRQMDSDESLPKCPVIVYTGRPLSEDENQLLLKYADSVIVKGVKSPERLLDETALFLHRVIAEMPEDKQRTIKQLHNGEAVLVGKRILVVDDDARNAFALSKLLGDKGLQVHIAANGQKALELLDKTPIDLVLMDIMLPGMDGYTVIQRIRAQARFRNLPILALTAKAMPSDREKCIAAGANDYLSKPVDADRLLSMLRVWLSRE